MTSVEAMNAIVRDRARIREGIVNLRSATVVIDGHEEVWIRRGEVLSLLTDNVMEATKIPVQSV